MKKILALLIFTAAGAAQADYYPLPDYQVFGKTYSEADERAIDKLIQRFRNAWADRNVAAVAAIHTADLEWINAFGKTFRDREQLEKFLANVLFPAFEEDVWRQAMASYRPISRRYLSSDVAVINAQIHSTPGSALGEGGRRVSVNFVLIKREGHWKIAQQVISDIRERRGSDN